MQSFSWVVVHWKKLWRTLGFPTANVAFDTQKISLIPATYGVGAEIEWQKYFGVWVFLENTSIFEVHILDFEGDIYDQILNISLLFQIRENRKFDSLEALKEQIIEDIRTMNEYREKK